MPFSVHKPICTKEVSPLIVQESEIDQVIVTNTIPLENQKLRTNKIRTVDISILIAEAIR